MGEFDGKGISQLLLSPLFLLNYILGTIVPGALLLLLLGLKGNLMLRNEWLSPLFGYKTKVAIFALLAYVLGSILRLPIQWISALLKLLIPKRLITQETGSPTVLLKGQPPAVEKMLNAVITDGVLLATPSLIDRLSHVQTSATFHIGAGTALLVAAFVPGDGSLRWIEGVLGLGMFYSGLVKAHEFKEHSIAAVGIGMANILASLTPQQIMLAKAAIKSLGLGDVLPGVAEPVPTAPLSAPPTAPRPTIPENT